MAGRREQDDKTRAGGHGAAQSHRIQRRMPGDEAPQRAAAKEQAPRQSRAPRPMEDWDVPTPASEPQPRTQPKQKPKPAPKGQKSAKPPARAARQDAAVREKKPRRRMLKRILLTFGAFMLVCILVLGAAVVHSTRNDDLWLELEQIPYRTETVLYYTDKQTGERGVYTTLPSTQNKEYVDGALMPQTLKDAFVAVEDRDFYKHSGVSIKRTLFAAVNEVKHIITGSYIGGDDGRKQGASTIDQQLIKNLTRDDENSNAAGYMRKIREIYRAFRMDARYEKDTILEAYLNTISFTGNTAGVQAEAKKLFGKTVDQLSLAECASLAAITRNPSRYNPNTNPEIHTERRNYVLAEMLDQGYITQQQHDEAVAEPLATTGQGDPERETIVTSYFTDTVMDAVVSELVAQRGITRKEATDLLYNGGLQIETTVVPQLQASMERTLQNAAGTYPRPGEVVNKALTNEDGTPMLDAAGEPVYGDVTVYPQAAMVSLDYEGGICAVVGGLGEKEISRGFNRGTSAVRQVGSTMKSIGPYAVALENNKIHWSSSFLDAPVRKIKDEETGEEIDWPTNATNTYQNKDILVEEAFAKSINTVAVRVGEKAGNLHMYWFVHGQLGISTITSKDIDPGPLVLGSSTYGITPLEMAKAYAVFGNGGTVHDSYSFTSIKSGMGDVYIEMPTYSRAVLGSDTAYVMNRLMRQVMLNYGTASGMSVQGEMDSVGKTGTTSDHRDHWFVGLTPYYVTASWYGYDENLPLGVNSHWNPPILAWRAVMQEAQQGLPYAQFPVDESVVQVAYCTESGAKAGPNCPSATGYYKEDEQPQERCPIHG